MQEGAALLRLVDVERHFRRGRRVLRAVDGVSLQVAAHESWALVGESGCGKSTLGRCMLRIEEPSAGHVLFDGADLGRLSRRRLRALRPRMQMVFQDAAAALNPRRPVARAIEEPLRIQTTLAAAERAARVAALLALVGLRPDQADRYPHELSGGQRQRVGIARALALRPALLVADEPVSALDVSIQAQIVNLLMDLQAQLALTLVVISHDLGVVRQISSRVAVMYLGALVETGETLALFAAPAHPYTAALLASVPGRGRRSAPMAGEPPDAWSPPRGCRFHPRCPRAAPRCIDERPMLRDIGAGRQVACHFPL